MVKANYFGKQRVLLLVIVAFSFMPTRAQHEIYPQHFDLENVTLLDGPFKKAMDLNIDVLLQYDVNRLLTPFLRQAGLLDSSSSKYFNWQKVHPSFTNWGSSGWSLEGHIGGHYLTALSLAYAAEHNVSKRTELKKSLDYMLGVLDDCQKKLDKDTLGMKGFLGGQPINRVWTELYAGNLKEFNRHGSWVPFYCEHKVLAGLRDAWIYTDSKLAKKLYRKLCDWSVNVVSHLSTQQMQNMLRWEHGGMSEVLADAYRLLGDKRYLDAAKKYCQQEMVDGMQTLSKTFLDNKHANTQVPKYIGFERISQEECHNGTIAYSSYSQAAHNFWEDVANHRTVCIGGNSVSEHFLPTSKAEQYIANPDGPESCNSNNMLKLTEILFDENHDARYADFYETIMWNHILSTQDPKTGGYVYFTSLRPQSYRIYSQKNLSMWCCVGTGMENHSKYGHFIYTHSEDNKTLYVNLFTASQLKDKHIALTQETDFPYSQSTRIVINKGGKFTLAIRHPHWVGGGYAVKVNGTAVNMTAQMGTASYVKVTRSWKEGDIVGIDLPMTLRYESCPSYNDYIAFKYGPILLAAPTTACCEGEAARTGLKYESLRNEYAGLGGNDHAPGSVAKRLSLSTAPLLLGKRENVLKRIKPTATPCHFMLDVSDGPNKGRWNQLELQPFYSIHHVRYSCYWYQQPVEKYAESDMLRADSIQGILDARTIDFIVPGEQQSEAGHDAAYSDNTGSGCYKGEFYRYAKMGGYVEYTLTNMGAKSDDISMICRFSVADKGRKGVILVEGKKLMEMEIPISCDSVDDQGFFQIELSVPKELLLNKDKSVKRKVTFRLATVGTSTPRLFYLRMLRK